YLVHWRNYSIMDRTWEPVENLKNCRTLIENFHREHPTKPRVQLLRSSSSRGKFCHEPVEPSSPNNYTS
ncbi:hypothetical protein BD408DRAFT_348285, partial [Parasitella parasitica]